MSKLQLEPLTHSTSWQDRADREAMQATLAARREARAPAESAGSALNASS
jgi:hypothetical protein